MFSIISFKMLGGPVYFLIRKLEFFKRVTFVSHFFDLKGITLPIQYYDSYKQLYSLLGMQPVRGFEPWIMIHAFENLFKYDWNPFELDYISPNTVLFTLYDTFLWSI